MALAERKIRLQFQLGQGEFAGGSGNDTVELEGLRCSVNIVRQGVLSARADVQVWGMPLALMNQLTVTQKFFFEQNRYNQLTIYAGDDDDGMAMCFGGSIREAWADGQQQPDVVFSVSADGGQYELMQTVPPISFKGDVDAALVISGIAQQMNYQFENSGVTGKLPNPYYPGTPKAQLLKACEAVHCEWEVDDANRIIAIWPKGGARDGEIVLISKDTGLVGYPAFSQAGVRFQTLFNPNIEFGRHIRLESQFGPANGRWKVNAIAHRLESLVPGGLWFTDVECIYPENA